MSVLLLAFTTIFIAEMGDRTQLLSLILATQFRKPWPIIAGIFVATIANHAVAGLIGVWIGRFLTPTILDAAVGVSMIAMAVWALIPDKIDADTKTASRGAFVATLIAFFIAEIGDKTQLATIALVAGYSHSVVWIIVGTTLGMLAANIPVVLLGNVFANRLPLKAIHYGASALFAVIGIYFVVRACMAWH
jgi:putative Ca2+/H+ antiporter (TMEM165/GDT1 family)